jgi:OmpA-OmpF porin, OOP family
MVHPVMTQDSGAECRRTRAITALSSGSALALAWSLLLAPAFGATPKQAPPPQNASGIVTGVFYEFPDSQRNVDGGFGVNYAYVGQWGTRDAWELRVFADTLETGIAGATDFYQYGAGLDMVKRLGNVAAGHPYFLVGAGVVSNDVDPDEDDGISAYGNVGIGWRMAPWSGWGIRPRFELRGVYDSFKEGQVDVIAGLALEIPSARERVVEVERVVERIVEKPVDRIVEKEVVREVQVPPPDRDADGILDALDKCPDTVAGAKVAGDGCVHEEQVVVLPNIEFAYASADLTADGKTTLGMVVRFMQDQANVRLDVWGHTDSQGEDAYNLNLSQKRAAAVVEFLASTGIAHARLTSAGFGESKPIATNANLAGRARNRRVELHIRTGAEGSP